MVVPATRRCAAWALSGFAITGSLLGWAGMYVLAETHAAVTAWWVGVAFLGSPPAAIAAIAVSRRQPQLAGPFWFSLVGLFIFAGFWVLMIGFKVLSR